MSQNEREKGVWPEQQTETHGVRTGNRARQMNQNEREREKKPYHFNTQDSGIRYIWTCLNLIPALAIYSTNINMNEHKTKQNKTKTTRNAMIRTQYRTNTHFCRCIRIERQGREEQTKTETARGKEERTFITIPLITEFSEQVDM